MNNKVAKVLQAYSDLDSNQKLEFLNELGVTSYTLEMDEIVERYIARVRQNWRSSHPTKKEILIRELQIQNKSGRGVPIEFIASLCEGNDLKRIGLTKIGQMNRTLTSLGGKIISPSRYWLVPWN